MNNFVDRKLELFFSLENDEPASPTDFAAIFEYAEYLVREIVREEALSLFSFLELPSAMQIESIDYLSGSLSKFPAPAEIVSVEHKSPWEVLLTVSALPLIYFLRKFIQPIALKAWDESLASERVRIFLRDKIFGGAKEKVNRAVTRKRRKRGIKVTSIQQVHGRITPDAIEIKCSRETIFEAEITEETAIKEFLQKLKKVH